MASTTYSILKRIRVHGRGWVFAPKDFLDLGARGTVDQALFRLTREKTIRRLASGLYDYPRIHKGLGILSPNPDDVAAALAAKSGSRVQISGQRAANLLGLSSQVPAQSVYVTDGPSKKVKIGSQVITLKSARPSKFPGTGSRAGLAIQAIRAMGPKADKNLIASQLSSAMSSRDGKDLTKLHKYAPGWSNKLLQTIERSLNGHVGEGQRERSRGVVQRDRKRERNITGDR